MSPLVFYYCICTSVAVTVANHLCLVCYHFSCSIITVVTVSRPCCLSKIIPYHRAFREGPGVPIQVTFLARNCIYKQYNVSLPYCKRSKLPFAVASHSDVLTDSSRNHSSPTNALRTPKKCSGVSEPSEKFFSALRASVWT